MVADEPRSRTAPTAAGPGSPTGVNGLWATCDDPVKTCPPLRDRSRQTGVVLERPPAGAIPDTPGSYQFRDRDGRVIYVGKAKSLRSRLSNYFQNPANLLP